MTDETVKFKGENITVSEDQYETIKLAIATQDPTDAELKLYFYDCDRRGVHPLDKLIHFSKRAGRYTPIASIDYMRIRAESSGAYAGSDDAVFVEGDKYPKQATVTVWKVVGNQRFPFTATARWSEYAPADMTSNAAFMWRKMPHTMLAKCAEALDLRKAFPGQLAGLYTNDEMNQAGIDILPPTIDVHPLDAAPAGSMPEPKADTVSAKPPQDAELDEVDKMFPPAQPNKAVQYDKTQMANCLDAKTVKLVVALGLSENTFTASRTLAKFKPQKAPLGKLVEKMQSYRDLKDNGIETDVAIERVNVGRYL